MNPPVFAPHFQRHPASIHCTRKGLHDGYPMKSPDFMVEMVATCVPELSISMKSVYRCLRN